MMPNIITSFAIAIALLIGGTIGLLYSTTWRAGETVALFGGLSFGAGIAVIISVGVRLVMP